ncbi:TPA: tail fiber assembly protein [Citrobacter freundii]|uniref:tail fiber assembly protein n=1 Tax=Citrobacter portucalensis TaxID=1639133 RepID=UPI001A19013E|nr:tail fiber assembly protein [Citrobacter freundii]HAT7548927.1 tail fiber assembly protein [Citrobacter freundii]HAT7608251.1 tail fiber assembly protein [Citrobacter freundii]
MKTFYSPSLNGFLLEQTAESYSGNDLVEVTEETYIEFIKGRGNQVMLPGQTGPVWGDVAPPTHEQLLADVERQRTALLLYADTVTADWRTELALGDISDDDRIKLSAWMAYKRAVKAVIAEDAIRDGFQWPAIPA